MKGGRAKEFTSRRSSCSVHELSYAVACTPIAVPVSSSARGAMGVSEVKLYGRVTCPGVDHVAVHCHYYPDTKGGFTK